MAQYCTLKFYADLQCSTVRCNNCTLRNKMTMICKIVILEALQISLALDHLLRYKCFKLWYSINKNTQLIISWVSHYLTLTTWDIHGYTMNNAKSNIVKSKIHRQCKRYQTGEKWTWKCNVMYKQEIRKTIPWAAVTIQQFLAIHYYWIQTVHDLSVSDVQGVDEARLYHNRSVYFLDMGIGWGNDKEWNTSLITLELDENAVRFKWQNQ